MAHPGRSGGRSRAPVPAWWRLRPDVGRHPSQTGGPHRAGDRLPRLERRLPAGSRASAPGSRHRRRDGVSLAARAGCQTDTHRDCGRFGGRRFDPCCRAQNSRRRPAVARCIGAAVAVDRHGSERRHHGEPCHRRYAGDRGRHQTACARVPMRREYARPLCVTALCGLRGLATDLYSSRRRRSSA